MDGVWLTVLQTTYILEGPECKNFCFPYRMYQRQTLVNQKKTSEYTQDSVLGLRQATCP